MDKENYYEQYVKELNKLKSSNSDEAYNYISNSLLRLGLVKGSKMSDKNIDILGIIIVSLLILLIGFININVFYFAGFVFFISGLLISLFLEKGATIFLFSHGLSGLCFMVVPTLLSIMQSPIMTDSPKGIITYMTISITILLVAFISVIVSGLNSKFKNMKHIKIYIMIAFLIGILLVQILPMVEKYL